MQVIPEMMAGSTWDRPGITFGITDPSLRDQWDRFWLFLQVRADPTPRSQVIPRRDQLFADYEAM